MSGFSAASRRTIEDFASSLGLPARPGRDGSYGFAFDRSGTLSLTPSPDGSRVVASLARRSATAGEASERQAFSEAGLDPTTSTFLHAGLAPDGSLVLALAIEESEISLPALDEALRTLMARHASLAGR